jgi:phospholipid transport system substrate-binding protein
MLITGLLLAGLVVPSQAQDRVKEVRQLLEQRDREIKALLGDKTTLSDQQREQLKTVVNEGIDFELMGREALGAHWNALNAAQRKEFVDVFSRIVRDQSLSNLDIYRTRVAYGEITITDGQARAVTTTVYKDVPAEVVYLLRETDGTWRVNDIILDNVSTADGYARSFQSVIRKRGFDSLMASLRKKLDSGESSS